MEHYLSGSAIIERYNLSPFQFGLLINRGAVPLSPLTGEPLLCLTEPESWLHDLNAAILEITGLLLVLWETFPKVPNLKSIARNSFIILASYPLYKLSAHKATQGLFEDKSPVQREPKGFFAPLAGLFSKSLYPELYRSAFFHTSALLHSANGKKNIWPLLQKIDESNDKWLKSYRKFFTSPLNVSYENYLNQFFFEQTHGQIEHQLVRELLDDFTSFVPKLQTFTLHYWETAFAINSPCKIKSTYCDPSTWALSASMLANWENGTNLHRLNTLIAIIQDLRKDFFQIHLPWEKPIKVTRLEESFNILEKAVFAQQSIDQICAEAFTPQHIEINSEIPKDDEVCGQDFVKKSSPLDTGSTAEEGASADVPSPSTTDLETPAHWAAIYRAHKDLTADQDEKDTWEMMALRLEGLTGYEIYKKVFPHKAKQVEIGTAKSHVSRRIKNRGVRLLTEAELPVLPQLLPGKKGKW